MLVAADQVERFLVKRLGLDARDVALIGTGAWSRCFGFRSGTDELVVRFGSHLDDFEKDRKAHDFAGSRLPIPEVLDIGDAFDGHYAVSSRVFGSALESCSARQWSRTLPSLVAAFEALRGIDVDVGSGWGLWNGAGVAAHGSWRAFLLSVDADAPARRRGWRAKLQASPNGDASFRRGYGLLEQITVDDVPRCVVHCDLINKNVHVERDTITGVFDWGCSIYGDPLYELALFKFWAPWHPMLDVGRLCDALDDAWRSTGHLVDDRVERDLACTLHIALDHIAYNAHLEDWSAVAAVEARMHELVTAV